MAEQRDTADELFKYEYAIDACDVFDMERLQKYRDKRRQWLDWLIGDRSHAIRDQILAMLWNDAVFRMIDKSREIARRTQEPSCALNSAIAGFVDQGYVATQVMAIRRLLDKGGGGKNNKRGVISLPRLLQDIRKNRCLITRENYVAHDGLPYNYMKIERKHFEELLRNKEVTFSEVPSSGPQAFRIARCYHEVFDRLCGTKPDERQRIDTIPEALFDDLDRRLDESGARNVIELGNKFIAHAADYQSRQTLADNQYGIGLNKFAACHESIYKAADTINDIIPTGSGYSLIPINKYIFNTNLDKLWLSGDGVGELTKFLDAHWKNLESWQTKPRKS